MNNYSHKQAYVVGSGPNGLAAAIELARAGCKTTLIEAQQHIGGGLRSAELTLPGFTHDVCSAVHPLGVSSPLFQEYPLAEHGLRWIEPECPLAHPLDNGNVALLQRDFRKTARDLGDEREYARIASTFVPRWNALVEALLRPLTAPRHPLLMARFGLHAFQPALWEARKTFQHPAGRALYAGIAGHAALPFTYAGSAAFAWVLGLAGHAVGWPIPRGGSQSIANALASYFESLGGTIVTGERVRSLSELSDADLILCDVGPKEFLHIAGNRLPDRYRRKLESFKRGPAAFKMDWALSGPIPWRNSECAKAATVHVGGNLDEITESESAAFHGVSHNKPFIILVQPTLFDATRAPEGCHTVWAYCHVPNGSTEDVSDRIEAQIERFAPGFKSRIIAKHVITPLQWEAENPNNEGGDVLGGAQTLPQLAFRPTNRLYATPLEGVYLCSSSTPPGGGVHGMCGYHAVKLALLKG